MPRPLRAQVAGAVHASRRCGPARTRARAPRRAQKRLVCPPDAAVGRSFDASVLSDTQSASCPTFSGAGRMRSSRSCWAGRASASTSTQWRSVRARVSTHEAPRGPGRQWGRGGGGGGCRCPNPAQPRSVGRRRARKRRGRNPGHTALSQQNCSFVVPAALQARAQLAGRPTLIVGDASRLKGALSSWPSTGETARR